MGPPGSGKTSFAREISKKLNIPNFDLDDIAFREDSYKKISPSKRNQKLREILNKNKRWIIEGSYAHPWINPAIEKSDLTIILKRPFTIITRKIFSRYLKRKIKRDKAKKGAGKIKEIFKLMNYAYTYPKDYFLKHLRLSEKFNKKKLIFTKKAQLKKFIKELK